MRKTSKHIADADKGAAGVTSDGIRVLSPATKSKHFTSSEAHAAVLRVRDADHGLQNNVFVERRDNGEFAVRKHGSERASAILPTQKDAIARAKDIARGGSLFVERVRHTAAGKSDRWRKL